MFIDQIYRNQYRWNKQNTAESQRLKIYVQNVHHSREHMHSNDYATAQSLMVSVVVSRLGATHLHFLEPGVKVNGDYYRNTVLLNMLLLDIRSVYGDYYVFQQDCQDGAPAHRACDTCHHAAQRERRQSLSFQRCGHLIRQIWIRWTTASGICFKRGSTARGSMMLRSWKNVCWGSGGCWTMHTVIATAIAQWHSRLNGCVRVNVGHFEHKFWVSDFLLCFACFVDTGFPQCDRYKHV